MGVAHVILFAPYSCHMCLMLHNMYMIFTNKFSNDWLIEVMFDIHDYLILLNILGFSQQDQMILIIATNMLITKFF